MDFEAILSRPFRWPQAGDRLFTTSDRWDGDALLAQESRGRLVMMMTGYKVGADLMVARATDARHDRDALVFPILFNYRQYIELSLKFLISTYGPKVGIEGVWTSHDLTLLWQRFLEVLSAYGVGDPDGAEAVIGEIIAEFASVDPGSFTHRYPVDTKGRPIDLSMERLDLVALADVMEAVHGYVLGCDGYLDDLMQAGP